MADKKIAKPAKIPKPVFQTNLPTNELFDEIIDVFLHPMIGSAQDNKA